MYRILKPILIVAAASLLISCGGRGKTVKTRSDFHQNPHADALVDRLFGMIASGKIMYGHQDDLAYGHTWRVEDWSADELTRSDVKAVTGDFPAVVGFDLGGIELGNEANLDGVPFDLIRKAAVTHHARGGVVTFSWHPRNPLTGGDAWDVSSDQVVKSILDGGEKHDEFMLWLQRLGDFLMSLKDENGDPVPVIFRPWHENLGSWFWWGGRLCTAEQYIALYRLTYDYVTVKRRLPSILWCYSPNSGVEPMEYMSRYPGDDIIDILGVDHYQYVGENGVKESEVQFAEQLKSTLVYMNVLAADHEKILAVTETGFEGIPDPEWWTGTLYPAIKDFPVAYVLTWRNAWDRPEHYYAPFTDSADADDFRAFHDNEQIVFLEH